MKLKLELMGQDAKLTWMIQRLKKLVKQIKKKMKRRNKMMKIYKKFKKKMKIKLEMILTRKMMSLRIINKMD